MAVVSIIIIDPPLTGEESVAELTTDQLNKGANMIFATF